MKKWLVLFAGIILQLIIGGVYAWSVFVPSLEAEYGFSKGQCAFIFGLIIAVFTIAMIQAGRILHRKGPARTAAIGAVLYGAGYIGASFSGGNFIITLLSLGLLTGSGIGFIYICPLTSGMKWFPDHKGLITGIAVAGFGGGAVLFSSVSEWLLSLPESTISSTFRIIGFAFGGAALLVSFLLSMPEEEESESEKVPLNIKKYILSRDFLLIFAGIFGGTFAGLLVVGNLKPILLASDVPELKAVIAISLFAVGNAGGRIFWGKFFDKQGARKAAILSLFSLSISIAALLIPLPDNIKLAVVFFVGTGFGSCFVVYAMTVQEVYGINLFTRLYPIIFLGYGLAAILGPVMGGSMADAFNNFTVSIIIAAILPVISAAAFSGLKTNR